MPAITFSGIASGIDGEAIIKSMTDSRRVSAIPIENKLEINKQETEALEQINSKLLTLSDTVKDFLTLRGGSVSKSASSSNEDALMGSANASAQVGSSTIEILNLAQNGRISFGDRFTALDGPIAPGLSGSADITITIGTGAAQTSATVSISSTTTLSDLATQISDALPGKVSANFVNVSTTASPEYAFVINGMKSGVEEGTLTVTVAPELTGLGIFATQSLEQAEDAIIQVPGIGQVRRPTNQVTDLIPGVTLDLKQEGGGPVTIGVSNDAEKTAKKLADFVAAYNDLLTYSNENDKIERVENDKGATNIFGSLARTRLDDQAIDSVRGALFAASSGVAGSSVQILADLGITTERDGTLKFDSEKFTESVAEDPVAVDKLLNSVGDRLASQTGIIAEYTKFNGLLERSQKSNEEENANLNERLQRLERSIEQQRQMLMKLFANLESKIGQMNSASSAFQSIVSPSSNNK